MFVPRLLLKQLYTFGSLKNADDGVRFSIKNRLSDAQLTGLRRVSVAGRAVALDGVRVELAGGRTMRAAEISEHTPLPFALRDVLDVHADGAPLPPGKHAIEIEFDSRP